MASFEWPDKSGGSGDDGITSLTGDVTGTGPGATATTLATVNSNVGTFGSASKAIVTTVNGKGLVTAVSETNIAIAESQVTNLVSDLALKAPLASPTFTGTVTIPSGAALATPATLVGTNITGTAAGLTAGTASIAASLTSAYLLAGNNFNNGFAVYAAPTTITLTSSSPRLIRVTGAGTQVVTLPNATTLQVGHTFVIYSAGPTLTINDNGGNLKKSLASLNFKYPLTLTDNSTSNGVWTGQSATPILEGGTGSTVALDAFNAFSPMTTNGDLIYGAGAGSATRLPIGSTNNVLTVVAGIPTWAAIDAILPSQTGNSGKVLGTNGTTSSWVTANTGTVTSVGLSVPATSIFGVSGSPVTVSGTLGITTTGTSGGIPYFSSTSQLATSGALTSGQIVLGGGAGSAPTTAAPSAVGASWVLLTSASASSSATIDFTSLATSGYSAWKVIITDCIVQTSTAQLLLRISTGGSFKSGASDYAYTSRVYGTDGGASGSSDDTASEIPINGLGANNTDGYPASYEITIPNPGGTTQRKTAFFSGAYNISSGIYVLSQGAGTYNAGITALDGLRFLMSSGNIATGNFYVYGVRNA